MKIEWPEFEELINVLIEETKEEMELHKRKHKITIGDNFCPDCYIYEGKIRALEDLLLKGSEMVIEDEQNPFDF